MRNPEMTKNSSTPAHPQPAGDVRMEQHHADNGHGAKAIDAGEPGGLPQRRAGATGRAAATSKRIASAGTRPEPVSWKR